MFCQEFPALSALKDLVHHSGFEASGGWVVTCLLEAFQKRTPDGRAGIFSAQAGMKRPLPSQVARHSDALAPRSRAACSAKDDVKVAHGLT